MDSSIDVSCAAKPTEIFFNIIFSLRKQAIQLLHLGLTLDVLYKDRTGMRDDRYGYTMPLKHSLVSGEP